jgi:hypothetical protein
MKQSERPGDQHEILGRRRWTGNIEEREERLEMRRRVKRSRTRQIELPNANNQSL